MIRHLPVYLVEATLISALAWVGLLLAVNALRRLDIDVKPRWGLILTPLWLAVAAIALIMSELIGPEFTLHYYFGIWTLLGGGALWLAVWIRQFAASMRGRFGGMAKARKDG